MVVLLFVLFARKSFVVFFFVLCKDNALVKESFVRFFAHIMTGYREFVTLDEADKSHGEAGGTSSIDINAFLASRKGATRRFLTAFSRAQHFEEFIKASHRPEARDELFETLLAEKARNRQKLLRMPEFKSLTLRSKLRREPSAAHAGVAFDEQALITEQQTNSGAATDAADDLLQCDLCERVYSYEADLIIHKLKRHTPPSSDGLFHCTICHARAYADVEDLAFHVTNNQYLVSNASLTPSFVCICAYMCLCVELDEKTTRSVREARCRRHSGRLGATRYRRQQQHSGSLVVVCRGDEYYGRERCQTDGGAASVGVARRTRVGFIVVVARLG